jgi:hypothetical protein
MKESLNAIKYAILVGMAIITIGMVCYFQNQKNARHLTVTLADVELTEEKPAKVWREVNDAWMEEHWPGSSTNKSIYELSPEALERLKVPEPADKGIKFQPYEISAGPVFTFLNITRPASFVPTMDWTATNILMLTSHEPIVRHTNGQWEITFKE